MARLKAVISFRVFFASLRETGFRLASVFQFSHCLGSQWIPALTMSGSWLRRLSGCWIECAKARPAGEVRDSDESRTSLAGAGYV